MGVKRCFKCGMEKPRTEFYRHPRMGDGLLGKCKPCAIADSEARRKINLGSPAWVHCERARCRVRRDKYGTISSPIAQKRWVESNKQKIAAQRKAKRALEVGRIVSPGECEMCGWRHSGLHMHHFDYLEPLLVLFLCPKCHGLHHRKPVNIK